MVRRGSTAHPLLARKLSFHHHVFTPRCTLYFPCPMRSMVRPFSHASLLRQTEGDQLLLCSLPTSPSSLASTAPPSNLHCLSSSSFSVRGQLEGHKVCDCSFHEIAGIFILLHRTFRFQILTLCSCLCACSRHHVRSCQFLLIRCVTPCPSPASSLSSPPPPTAACSCDSLYPSPRYVSLTLRRRWGLGSLALRGQIPCVCSQVVQFPFLTQ